jgi:HK97 family phage major capsid protein
VPIGRHPGTLRLEQRSDGLAWSVELPESRADVREAVERGDLCAGSWRMVVGRDEWRGDVRHIHEVRELRDVSVVSSPAYAASVVEHRSQQQPERPAAPPAGPTPGPAQRTGGLRVEDRTADATPTLDSRVSDAIRSVRLGEVRSLTTTSAEPIAPPELSTWMWDRLRPLSIALASGLRIIPTDRESITWPKLTADVDPSWVAETDQIPAGDPGFASLTATPRKLSHRVELSNEVVDDSDPSAVDVVNTHLSTVLSLKLDTAIFEANPAVTPNSIRGLRWTAGIQQVDMGPDGAALGDYDVFIEAIGLLRAANVRGPYAIAAHPSVLTALELLKEEVAGSNVQLAAPAGLPPFYVSSALSTTEPKGINADTRSAYVYAPAQVVLVRRKDAEVELDRSRLFDRDMSEMRCKLRADLLVPNPQAVVRVGGIRVA